MFTTYFLRDLIDFREKKLSGPIDISEVKYKYFKEINGPKSIHHGAL